MKYAVINKGQGSNAKNKGLRKCRFIELKIMNVESVITAW